MTTTSDLNGQRADLRSRFGRISATDTGGDAGAVVCVAGLGMNASHFAPVAKLLSPNHRVISVNLPGFAGSDGPPEGAGIDECVHVVEEAVRHFGIRSAMFVGHSLGALVVSELAARAANLCERLVLLSPVFVEGPARVMQTVLSSVPTPLLASCLRLSSRITGFAASPGEASAALMKEYRSQTNAEFHALALGMRGLSVRCFEGRFGVLGAAIRAPTFMLWGKDDPLATEAARRRARAYFPSAEHKILEGCGHTPMWEQPDQVAREIIEFTSRGSRV